MTILVIAEHDNVALKSVTAHAVAAAAKISSEVEVLVAGAGCSAVAEQAAKLAGVSKVCLAQCSCLEHQLPENIAETVVALQAAKSYSHILFVSGASGKAAMPRVAAKLGVSALTDVCGVESADTFKRFIYAGGVLATVKTSASVVVATVRPTAFEVLEGEGAASVEEVQPKSVARRFKFESIEEVKSDRPDLLTAKRIVAVGRGVIDEAGVEASQALADKIGAALGSTRAVVDMSLVPNETQIGQTGKIVAPELYIALGISGAIQHTAGMKDSKVIVAVNKDEEAQMFEMCDYYLVADAAEVAKELTSKL